MKRTKKRLRKKRRKAFQEQFRHLLATMDFSRGPVTIWKGRACGPSWVQPVAIDASACDWRMAMYGMKAEQKANKTED